ncbi:MAG: sugar phosphate isomerase/epimerase [Flavobacteriaceae bacterium]|nr:sugar phosphate isomerase/epimerase [Bacteroidia bacterium]NNL59953.1 sugar phosphate isomerase/epimerase [Flavobacteriaceae bacterium]
MKFIKLTLIVSVIFLSYNSCKDNAKENKEQAISDTEMNEAPFFKLSLAQWSLHKAIIDDRTLDPMDFADKAKELGFEGVEYVSQLYSYHIEKMGMQAVLDTLKVRSERTGMENLLIMIDGEGDLASPDEKIRDEAVEKHKKWIDAAQFLGCHSIRVNLFGSRNNDEWVKASTDGLIKLSAYAATRNVNVLVENHGYLSSNADLLMNVMKQVALANCGTLPDFGNFCLEREGGERWGAKCVKEYDKYVGVRVLMTWAKAVSAKSYDFDEAGNETTIDYTKMLQIVKDADYTGYIGVEYEGSRLSEEEGIIATRDLLISASKQLN